MFHTGDSLKRVLRAKKRLLSRFRREKFGYNRFYLYQYIKIKNASPVRVTRISGFQKGSDETWNLPDYRYEVRAFTKRGFRNRVIYVRKSLSKDSTLDRKIIW